MLVRARTAGLAVGLALAAVLTFGAAQLLAAPTTFASCPHSDRTVPTINFAGARDELVPSGATGVLLCRYRGLNPNAKRFRLIASGQVRRAVTVAELRTQLNALPKLSGPIACPLDSGALIVAYFHYAHGSDDVVTVDTTGCELVSNGHVHRTASLAPGPQLVDELEALTR